MDLVAGITNFQQATLSSQIDFAVARKMMESQSQQGAAALQLIQAADKGQSQASDALASAATGLGSQIDTFA